MGEGSCLYTFMSVCIKLHPIAYILFELTYVLKLSTVSTDSTDVGTRHEREEGRREGRTAEDEKARGERERERKRKDDEVNKRARQTQSEGERTENAGRRKYTRQETLSDR